MQLGSKKESWDEITRLILNIRQVSLKKWGKGAETQERRSRLGLSLYKYLLGPPSWLSGKESTCQCRRHRFDPWVGKIPLGEERTCLENPTVRGAWQARVHGVTKTVGHNLETKNNDKTKHHSPQKLSIILPYCHQDLSMFIQTFQSFRSMRWNSSCCFELCSRQYQSLKQGKESWSKCTLPDMYHPENIILDFSHMLLKSDDATYLSWCHFLFLN